jgi:hypothetical protein
MTTLRTLYTNNGNWQPPLTSMHRSALIRGPAGSGKSTLLRALWYHTFDLAKVWRLEEWFSRFLSSKHRQLVPYSAELVGKTALQGLVVADDPGRLAEDLCHLLVVKQIGLCDPHYATTLRRAIPWLGQGAKVTGAELRHLTDSNASLTLLLGMDLILKELDQEHQEIWLAFDGWDDCVAELGEERDQQIQQLIGIGLLRLLNDYWRRWGARIHLLVALRSEVVLESGAGVGADFSKLLLSSSNLCWPQQHLWSLASRHLLNLASNARELTRMNLRYDSIWGWSCVKSPTLDQVLAMHERSGRTLKGRTKQQLQRIDKGRLPGTPGLVLDLLLDQHDFTEMPKPKLRKTHRVVAEVED